MRIDAHHHFWQPARGDYFWLRADDPAVAPLRRDFAPADLTPLRAVHGVAQTVLVQAADTVAETDFLLAIAREHAFVGGVVGWVDLAGTSAVADLDRLAGQPRFKGVRPMLQDLPEADWIARAPRADALAALQRLGLRFDALVKPWHLQPLLDFVRRHPGLPVVVDHAAKPQLAQGWAAGWAPAWREGLAALARCPNVVCKFSGLLTEMSPAQRATRDTALATLRPVWDTLLEAFGPPRLMWGSDWPVLTLADSYAGWVDLADALVGELSVPEQAAVRVDTAARFYGLAVP